MRAQFKFHLAITLVLAATIGGFGVFSSQDVFAAEAMCPGGTNPDSNVLWCDDFEDGTWLDDWSFSPWCCDTNQDGTITLQEMNGVVCGSKGFNDNCAAWTNENRYGQHYADKVFAIRGHDELYVRWYVYLSYPFRWDPVGDKSLILHDGTGAVNPYVVVNQWGTGKPLITINNNYFTPCVSQSVPDQNGGYPDCVNRKQNLGNDVTLEPGKWYVFEWYLKLNDPGIPNGVTKLWVDEAVPGLPSQTLRASYTDVLFTADIHVGMLLTTIWLSAYHNTGDVPPSQHQKWDQIVISKEPIGPVRGFRDDFETAVSNVDGSIGGWDGPANPSAMYLTGQASAFGQRSLELKYNPDSHGAGYMFKYFSGLDQAFYRWYQRWSPGFVWEPDGTGMVTLRPVSGYPSFSPAVLWGNGQLAIQALGIPEASWNFYQNLDSPVVFVPDRWYCIEMFVKLNTPGNSDGEMAAWIDGNLKLQYVSLQLRGSSPTDFAPSTAKIGAAMVNGYYGGLTTVPQLQLSWQDDHVVSTQRIGCR